MASKLRHKSSETRLLKGSDQAGLAGARIAAVSPGGGAGPGRTGLWTGQPILRALLADPAPRSARPLTQGATSDSGIGRAIQ